MASMEIDEEDLKNLHTFHYCPECCEEIAEHLLEWHAEECDGAVEQVVGFLQGGSCHSPVVFNGLKPGDRVVIVRADAPATLEDMSHA